MGYPDDPAPAVMYTEAGDREAAQAAEFFAEARGCLLQQGLALTLVCVELRNAPGTLRFGQLEPFLQ
jgi:hypothetical protein